jgi:hypothetical protein
VTRPFKNPDRDQQTLDRMNALFEEQDRALPFYITWDVEPCDQTVGEEEDGATAIEVICCRLVPAG